ncbi:MAG: hypothetical protein ABI693_28715 [Bryobacteraceae bacterium]
MKLIFSLLFVLAPLAAQDQAKPAEPAKTETAAAPVEPPTAEPERFITGSVELGYRFRTGPGGDANTYRSVVNLGEGLRIQNFDFTIDDPSKHFWHNLTVIGSNWGGDPYNTLKVIAEKQRYYRFTADYRNISYFNFLPSFADPRAIQGVFFNERSYDTHKRMAQLDLELFPSRRIVPFFSYSRASDYGSGVTPFVTGTSNDYPIRTDIDDHMNNYRGGVRFEFDKEHITLEQGGTDFTDNQQVFSTEALNGDRTTPLLGQTLQLTKALQGYGITGDSIYTRALFNSNRIKWANVSGQFLYSRPRTNVTYNEAASGNFALLSALRFYNSSSLVGAGEASMPHNTFNIGVELHPGQRLRTYYSFNSNQFHNASSILLTEQLFFATSPAQLTNLLSNNNRLVLNYYQQRVDVAYDVTKRFTFRGGYRYEWGDANVPAGFLTASLGNDAGLLKRHVGLVGGTYRAGNKFTLTGEFEASNGISTYFRTSLQDYKRFRAVARYQLLPSLLVTANATMMNNENPAPTVNYNFDSNQQTAGVFWTPKGGKRVSILAEYTHSHIRSDISFLDPTDLSRNQSVYRDYGHSGTAVVNLTPLKPGIGMPNLMFGGSFFVSNGSRPTNYYQPLGRFILPVHRNVNMFAEWKWYGLSQDYYIYEGFRSHLFTTGFRFTL